MNDAPHSEYSEERFRSKLRRYARVAGSEVVERALQLYYALQAPDTPKWAKTVILGALAYFILPTDAIPDMLPGVGYADDLGALAAALAMVHSHITDEMRAKARKRLRTWFGEETGADEADSPDDDLDRD